MATKKALGKAYDAGQAAQVGGFPMGGCPFELDASDERAAWFEGYESKPAEKWLAPGRRIAITIEDS